MKPLILPFWVVLTTVPLFAQQWQIVQNTSPQASYPQHNYGWTSHMDGDMMMTGAYSESSAGLYANGVVHVHEKDENGVWVKTQLLVASDAQDRDNFGVSFDSEGSYAVIGAPSVDVPGKDNLGAAYVFHKNANGQWQETQKLFASDGSTNDLFGSKVAMGDGYLMVYARPFIPANSTGGQTPNPDVIYIFQRGSNGDWQEIQKIYSLEDDPSLPFVNSLEMEGQTAFVGVPIANSDELDNHPLPNAGAVYVYQMNAFGAWFPSQKIVAPNRSAQDQFGYSLSLHQDMAMIGAPGEFVGISPDSILRYGAAYVLEKGSNGRWQFQQRLHAPDPVTSFGGSLAIGDDLAIVQAKNYGEGSFVYLFQQTVNQQWDHIQQIHAPIIDPHKIKFGQSISISGAFAVLTRPANPIPDISDNFCPDYPGVSYIIGLASATSVEEDLVSSNIKLYPNPSSGTVHIELDKAYPSIQLEINNQLGQLVFSKKEESVNRLTLNLPLPAGVYHLIMRQNEAVIASTKFVKQ